jgi:hypothetical protein
MLLSMFHIIRNLMNSFYYFLHDNDCNTAAPQFVRIFPRRILNEMNSVICSNDTSIAA